jgi:8-oxo-dGTP diphosphatase
MGTRREVMVVYRGRYGDWSLPKGKLEPDEPALHAAVREVYEESGVVGAPQLRLPTVEYLTGTPGESKTVDFWSMRMLSDNGREPDREVSKAQWVPVTEAFGVLTYAHDRGVLLTFTRAPLITAEVVLVRHAHAGAKEHWDGPDDLRPLSPLGRTERDRLARVAALSHPTRVVSASPLRCRETVATLGRTVEVDAAFDESSPEGLEGARRSLLALARGDSAAVVCSQGKVIPPLLAGMRPVDWPLIDDFATAKGTGWLLAFAGTALVSLDRVP